MKILFISNRGLLPIVDGHTRRSFNILKMMSEDHDVSFISLYEAADEISKNNIDKLESMCSSVEFFKAPNKSLSIEMISRLLVSFLSFKPYILWRHFSYPLYSRAKILINSKGYDLVMLDNLPIAYCFVNNSFTPQVITDHDVSYMKCSRMAKQQKNILAKLFYYFESIKLKYFERKIIGKIDLCITVSESDKINLHRINKSANLFVIENGVDTDEFNIDNNHSVATNLLWIGGFSNISNKESIKHYIENIHRLVNSSNPEVKLDIIGGGDTEYVKKLSQHDDSINVLGYVEDIQSYAEKSGIFIAPITSGGGTKLKVIEAMAFGKAIVTTSIGCEGISGTDGKEYVVADTADEFAKAIIHLINNDDLRFQLGNNARKFVKKQYDWKIIKEKLDKVYSINHKL